MSPCLMIYYRFIIMVYVKKLSIYSDKFLYS